MRTKDWIVHDEHNIKGFKEEYSWLSNMHDCPIYYEGLYYGSSEAAYQAAKCANINDRPKFQNISGKQAKKLSKTIKTRPRWDSIKSHIMAEIVLHKFLYNKDLQRSLLKTGDKYLEEANDWGDDYWGVFNGEGQNVLGKILMATRAYFKELKRK